MYHKTRLTSSKSLSKTKKTILNIAKEKFLRNAKLKSRISGKSKSWKECAFLINVLGHGWKRIAMSLLKLGCRVTKGDEKDFTETPLYHAIRFDDIVLFKQILRNSISNEDTKYLNLTIKKLQDMVGYTPLHLAVSMGNTEMVRVLLKLNANVNAKDANEMTPLHLAWYCWSSGQQIENYDEIIDLILSAHDERSENSVDDKKLSHFHIACTRNNVEHVRKFLERGVDVNMRVSADSLELTDCTPLYTAVKYNRKEVVRILLQHNADVHVRCEKDQTTVLLEASTWKCQKFYKLGGNEIYNYEKHQLHGIPVNEKAWESNRADQLDIISLLMEHGSKLDIEKYTWDTIMSLYRGICIDCWTCRCYSTYINRIYSGILPHESFSQHDMVLSHIIRITQIEFYVRRRAIINRLFDGNVNVNARDIRGKTILHYLAGSKRRGNVKWFKSLLKRNADPNILNNDGDSPLEVAVKTRYGKLIRIFLKKNMSTSDWINGRNSTALHYAYTCYNWCPRDYSLIAAQLIAHGFDVNVLDSKGNTPLHVASSCSVQTMALLLDAGADINVKNLRGDTIFRAFHDDMLGFARTAEAIKQRRDEFNLLRRHILKLKAIGLHVSESIETDCRIFEAVYRTDNVDAFLSECNVEIEMMKSIMLSSYISLHDVIFKSANEIFWYASNMTFARIVKSITKQNSFPIYGYLLKLKYKQCSERFKLFKKAGKLLPLLLKDFELPFLCITNILKHFENRNLEYLLKS